MSCSVTGCNNPHKTRGFCGVHYNRKMRSGEIVPTTLADRFWSKVDRSGGPAACWPWTGSRSDQGYGSISVNGELHGSHRVAYELMVGPIEQPQLDHLCRNPPCCNPAHLEPVTGRENTLRGLSPQAINARKTTCPKGHPLDGPNLDVQRTRKIGGRLQRVCRACAREHSRKNDAKRLATRRTNGLCWACGRAQTGGSACALCREHRRKPHAP